MRLRIEKEDLDKCLTEDGDVVITTEDFYFFKRGEIASEEGFHLEFVGLHGTYELYIPYKELRQMLRQMENKIYDYAIEKDEYK